MGTGYSGNYSNTTGAVLNNINKRNMENNRKSKNIVFNADSKKSAYALLDALPRDLQDSFRSFLKKSSNNDIEFSIVINSINCKFIKKVPGRVKGSYAKYVKIVDMHGNKIKMYKDTYDNHGKFVHRKEK